ncbi:MAG: hypothetical protein J5I65_14955 [Aridibacter famidurans]|nr:hypothetical protein [Aridibacter famidurans]
MSQSIVEQVITRIYGKGRGWAFSPRDFTDLGSRSSVDVALFKLHEQDKIRRVIRGIYDYPRYSKLLERRSEPDINQVANALARKFGWRIQPGGAASLNLIGLSAQVPGRYLFYSNGPARRYQLENLTIEFTKRAPKNTGFKYPESGVIVSALHALGRERIDETTILIIREWIPEKKRKRILRDTKGVTDWTYEVIKKICDGSRNGQDRKS